MKLTDSDIKNIIKHENNFIIIDDVEYYVKRALDGGLELISSEIATHLGINSAKYYFVKTKDTNYELSLSLRNFGVFRTGRELDFNSNSLYDIWIFLEKKYPKECPKLVNDLVKVFIFDIFMINSDRNLGNIGILEEENVPKLYILDNEFIFGDYEVDLLAKLYYDEHLKNYFYHDIKGLPLNIERNLENLEYFLATSTDEYCHLVVDFYNKLTPEYIAAVFLKYENEGIIIDDKEFYLMLYKCNYNAIGKLLKERGLICEQRIS